MCLILILSCALVIFYDVHPTKGQKKEEEDASASNSSYYSTREMRDMCLKEWAGKTQEVQEYFDQLPSEEFKENSDTLKLMHYYEKKGLKDIDSKQIYNVTQQVREPIGYTIEVNDSYVPKYRITTSEEINMERYGTFNSKPEEDSSEDNEEVTTETVVTTEPPDSDGDKPGDKKKRKKWPPNMDPKGKVKRRKKKKALKADEIKRKERIEKEINIPKKINLKVNNVRMENPYLNRPQNNYQLGVLGKNSKTNKIKYEDGYRKNIENVLNGRKVEHSNMNKISRDGVLKGKVVLKQNINRKKHISIFDSFMSSCKLKHKHKDLSHHNHRNLSHSRQRSWSYSQHLRPFL